MLRMVTTVRHPTTHFGFTSVYRIFCLSALVGLGCATGPTPEVVRPPAPNQSASTCTVDEVTWTSVTDGFDRQQTIDLVGKLEAAAKADLERYKTSGEANATFSAQFQNIIKETSAKKFTVSQEVSDQAVRLRELECAIQRGTFKTNRDKAESTYLDIITNLGTQKKTLASSEK